MQVPYWRLSGFYLLYFASLGALIPYWSLYLQSEGYSPLAIGQLMAVIMATKFVAPYFWGWIADHTGQGVRVVKLASLLASLAFALVFIADGFFQMMLVMALFSFFWNATLPQFEAITFHFLGKESHRYSQIRLWGSVGFILTVVGIGILIDTIPLKYLPHIVLFFFCSIWVVALSVPGARQAHQVVTGLSLRKIVFHPGVLALLAMSFFLQASHGTYYTFYSIYLENAGYTRPLIGGLWALGVLAEIGVFMVMHLILPRHGARRLLLLTLVLTSVRWLLIGQFADNLMILIFAQLFHAASFGVYHAAAVHLINCYFQGHYRGRGQALYSSISFGAGGAVGSLVSGMTWESLGSSQTFFLAALFSLVGLVITWFWIRPEEQLNRMSV